MNSPLVIKVCTGKSCTARFSKYIEARLTREYPDSCSVKIETCLCQNKCEEGPTVVFWEEIMTRMNPIKASEELKRRLQQVKSSFMK